MLWVLPTAYKIAPIRIIRFNLTALTNEQHALKRVRVDEDSALEKSTYVTNLLVDSLKISMETTGGDAYWLNGNNERHNRSIHNKLGTCILDINQHENKCFCAEETSEEVHRFRIHSAIDNISPQFSWYGKNPRIHELRTFGCDIYPTTSSPKKLN